MASLGEKVDKVDKESINVDLHSEDIDSTVEGIGLYNHMYSTR